MVFDNLRLFIPYLILEIIYIYSTFYLVYKLKYFNKLLSHVMIDLHSLTYKQDSRVKNYLQQEYIYFNLAPNIRKNYCFERTELNEL